MCKVSILICSWQAPSFLDETLLSVSGQEGLNACEVILVNNGFSETRANDLQNKFSFLKIIQEPTPGLTYARRAAFRSAKGDFFLCIDDDNFLKSGFIKSLIDFVTRHLNLGCICPVVLPRWETVAPEWLQNFGVRCLSYTVPKERQEMDEERVWNHPDTQGWPWPPGGGMIIHRRIAEDYLSSTDKKRLGFGRVGKGLGGCEDQDIYLRYKSLGMDVGFSEKLVLYHHIPEERTRYDYLFKVVFRTTQDWAVLQRLWRKESHPFASDELPQHLKEFFRLPYAWLRILLRTRKSIPEMPLEWAHHAGFLLGWYRDALSDWIYSLEGNKANCRN
jgi:glycosyltransferase involved in cell wall biosynthesis